MAIGWLTALKLVPWADVIEAAPGLAKSARGLFKRTQDAAPTAADVAAAAGASARSGDTLAQATQRIAVLEASLARAIERQQAGAELLDKLASQNAEMVTAIDVLGKNSQALRGWLIAVGIVAIAALVWVAFIAR